MKKVIALLLAAVMVFALCACGQQGAEGKDPAAKLPEFKLGIPMENTANPAQYSYLENMVYLCGNFPNGGTAVAEADDLTDPDHMISSVEKLISAGCNMITICPCNDTMLIKVAKLCEENKVYWAVAWRDILDPEVRDVVYASPYFCGTAVQSDLNAGYAAVKAMGEAGRAAPAQHFVKRACRRRLTSTACKLLLRQETSSRQLTQHRQLKASSLQIPTSTVFTSLAPWA